MEKTVKVSILYPWSTFMQQQTQRRLGFFSVWKQTNRAGCSSEAASYPGADVLGSIWRSLLRVDSLRP